MLRACLKSGSGSIAVVEPLASRRSMLIDGLKSLKIGTVSGYPSLRDLLAQLEVSDSMPDWVVTPLLSDQPINAMHLLQLIAQQSVLKGVRVSLFIDPSEQGVLPGAYALGLLSHHMKSPDVMSQLATLGEMLAPEAPADDCLLAAQYLRRALVELRLHDERLKLEQALVALYPEQNKVLYHYAEALAACGRQPAAMSIAARLVAGGDPTVTSWSKALMERLVGEDAATAGQSAEAKLKSMAARWNLRLAAVVDPDEAARNLLVTSLQELGIKDVHAFADGQAAWEWLNVQGGAVDLVVMEWRLPLLSGEALVRHLRHVRRATMPIVIFSALVKPADRPALREFGVTDVIAKPLPTKQLATLVASVIDQDRRPKGVAAYERRIRLAAEAKNAALAGQLFDELKAKKEASEAQLKALSAELSFLAADYRKAAELGIQAMAELGEDIVLLNLIGKAFLRLRRPKEATQFLSRAQQLAPNNIERLCHLAEAHIEGDDPNKASEALAAAKAIGDAPEVVAVEAKLALATGAVDTTRDLAQRVRDPSQLVAFMNNRAIVLTEEQRHAEAIQIYETALQSIADDDRGLHALIRYNLALARIKGGNEQGAVGDLQIATQSAQPDVARKALSLLKRLVKALEAGTTLQLRKETRVDAVAVGEHRLGDMTATAGGVPGSHACRLVYTCDLASDPHWGRLLIKPPRFKARTTALAYGATSR